MKGHKGKLCGIETEAFSRHHHHYRRWRAGARKFAKRMFGRRVRLQARAELHENLLEGLGPVSNEALVDRLDYTR